MKKVALTSLFMIIFMAAFSINVFADTTGKVSLNLQDKEYKKDDQIVVEVNLAELNSDIGIITLGAMLDYNTDDLEYVSMKSMNEEWSRPSYYDATKKLIMDRSDLTKTSEPLFSITFKVKAETAKETKISIRNIEVSGGEGAFKLPDVTVAAKIVAPGGNSEENNQNTNTPSTNTNTNTTLTPGTSTNSGSTININSNPNGSANDNLANTKLPYTGTVAPIVLIILGSVIIVGVISFIKFRNNKVD